MTQPIIMPDQQARVEGQHPITATGQSFAIHEWSGSGPDYLQSTTPTMKRGISWREH